MDENIKEKIVKTTFELLKTKDMNSISVREITKAADVNVAAINYYFGGKAELFAYMMELYWEELCVICREILAENEMTKEKAKGFCLRFLKKEMSSTGILRSEQVMYQNYEIDAKTKERIELQFKAFAYMIQSIKPEISEIECKIDILSLLSSLTQPAFWRELTAIVTEDLDSFMVQYVDSLVEKL